ncbi:MAG: hypothetical protein A2Z77_09065 [Chloroflexi bacterium RBG_13_51_36]|nr:MAG: hypothetical protein A2Z77_09065 [Chloroflexi bacterium RBG_13_51_36]
MNKKLIATLLVVTLFLLVTATPVLADGVFFPDSMYRDLYESAQKAVIVCGNNTGNFTGNCTGNFTEHLILSVSFEGDAEDFAWVVPVPSKPEITVTDPELFWELSDFTATEIPSGHGLGCGAGGAGAPDQNGVDVIEEEVVGPYATAILSATNATALADWLNANGYAFPQEGEEIISEYIENEWYFVATKINAVDEGTGYALAEGAIEPIVLSFESEEIVFPLRISSLSASNSTPPEILLYVLADHVMVPEQYPLYTGYGNWTDNAFTLEFANNVSVGDLSEYEILPELVSTYLPGDEFYLTKLRGWISADQMVDIEMITYEEGEPLHSLAGGDANSSNVVVLATIIGPVFGLYLWRRRRRATTSEGSG